MRLLLLNLCVLLVTLSVTETEATADTISPANGNFLDYKHTNERSNGQKLLDVMKKHFDLSVEYLLSSKQYGSQYAQRPGMAKLLSEASDRQWEEGMDILKKFLQRGGSVGKCLQGGGVNQADTKQTICANDFKSYFKAAGTGTLTFSSNEKVEDKYVSTLAKFVTDSHFLTTSMNKLHHLSGHKPSEGGDAEIGHYLDKKVEKEAEIAREMAGYYNTLNKMKSLGVAVELFDSHL